MKKIIDYLLNIVPKNIKPGELITTRFKNGKVVEEKREKIDWKPNEADLDIVLVGCECGNQYDIPWDCLTFLNDEDSFCGQCGKSGRMKLIADPSPNKKEENEN